MLSVCIVVPTFRSKQYFRESFRMLEEAATTLVNRYKVRILVVLNGSDSEDEVETRLALEESKIRADLIVSQLVGQNNATNTGLEYCREHKIDIVQMVDDDQSYGSRTLLANIDTLVALKEKLGVLGLVGSRHLAPIREWSGVTAWIASMAFEKKQERPKFCIGGSLCTWVSEFPFLPPDETGIANDAYLCNVFYQRYREMYKTTGFMPIVFPEESVIYFNVCRNMKEYNAQQIRIRYGVLSAYNAFPEIKEELRKYFNWKFHCDDVFSPKPRFLNFVRWLFFRFLRRKANRRAEKRIAAGIEGIEWGVAHSTKEISQSSLRKNGH